MNLFYLSFYNFCQLQWPIALIFDIRRSRESLTPFHEFKNSDVISALALRYDLRRKLRVYYAGKYL
jgi:hypothetical protein